MLFPGEQEDLALLLKKAVNDIDWDQVTNKSYDSYHILRRCIEAMTNPYLPNTKKQREKATHILILEARAQREEACSVVKQAMKLLNTIPNLKELNLMQAKTNTLNKIKPQLSLEQRSKLRELHPKLTKTLSGVGPYVDKTTRKMVICLTKVVTILALSDQEMSTLTNEICSRDPNSLVKAAYDVSNTALHYSNLSLQTLTTSREKLSKILAESAILSDDNLLEFATESLFLLKCAEVIKLCRKHKAEC